MRASATTGGVWKSVCSVVQLSAARCACSTTRATASRFSVLTPRSKSSRTAAAATVLGRGRWSPLLPAKPPPPARLLLPLAALPLPPLHHRQPRCGGADGAHLQTAVIRGSTAGRSDAQQQLDIELKRRVKDNLCCSTIDISDLGLRTLRKSARARCSPLVQQYTLLVSPRWWSKGAGALPRIGTAF